MKLDEFVFVAVKISAIEEPLSRGSCDGLRARSSSIGLDHLNLHRLPILAHLAFRFCLLSHLAFDRVTEAKTTVNSAAFRFI